MRAERKAFTIMEIIVVILIIGISVAIFSSGGFKKSFEKQRSLEAMHNLQLIYNAEKRYLLEKGEYYNCSACTAQDLTSALGVLISTNYFTYSIESFFKDGNRGFEAVAVRKSGICQGKRMYVTHVSSDVVKECAEWQ